MGETEHFTHLFSYRFEGKTYSIDIIAKDEEEAKARLKALAWAQYDGVLVWRAPTPLGIVARAIVALRNLFRRGER